VTMLDHALMYGEMGWSIFPVHSITDDGRCTCGPTEDCVKNDTAGKHPRNGGGHLEATDDLAQIGRWWTQWPDANIGLHLAGTDLVALDVDPRNGGDETFAALEAVVDMPQTYWHHTGGGGKHVIYLADPGVAKYRGKPELYDIRKDNKRHKKRGVDVKFNGYVLLPPSRHKSGNRYERGSDGIPPAPHGHALAELIVLRRKDGSRPYSSNGQTSDTEFIGVAGVFAGIETGDRDVQAFKYACSLRARSIKIEEAKALMTMAWHLADKGGHEFPLETALEKVDRAYDQFDEGLGGLPADYPDRNTDRNNGGVLAHAVRDHLTWTKALGWLVWDGTRWAPDDLLQRERFVNEMADALWRQVPNAGEAREHIIKRAHRLESGEGRARTLEFARTELARKTSDFDRNRDLFNCQSGTLDTRTGRLRDVDPADLITRVSPVSYDESASDAVWSEFLEAAMPDAQVRAVFQRFMGSTLAGEDGDKAFLVPHGPTNTGKSTATEPIARVLGNVDDGGYAASWEADVVQSTRNVNRGEKLAKVRAARLVIVGELTKGSRFDDAFMKRVTGGDTLDAKALYKDSFSFRPEFHVVMHSNYVPKTADPAVHGRMKILPFPHVFEGRDAGVKNYLETNEGAQRAILKWLVDGCGDWRKNGLGKMPWLDDILHSTCSSHHRLRRSSTTGWWRRTSRSSGWTW
jgi:putative DNA primase/helicase